MMVRRLSQGRTSTNVGFKVGGFGKYPFEERPELARRCMEAIASWAQVEACMLQLFVAFVGSSRDKATAMYLAIRTAAPKTAAMDAVATLALEHDQTFAGYKAIYDKLKAKEKHYGTARDKLAHGIWGHSPDLMDELLWIDPRDLPLDFHPRELGDFFNNISFHTDKIFAYNKGDFEGITANNDKLSRWIISFKRLHMYSSPRDRKRRYDELCLELGLPGS